MNSRLTICALLLALACSSPRGNHTTVTPQIDPRLQAHTGPSLLTGDAGRGRQAFLDLHCNSCHRIAGDDVPRPANATKALLLHDLDQLTADSVAMKIVARSGVDPTAGTEMVAFTDAMTLRQLADVVAYLREPRH